MSGNQPQPTTYIQKDSTYVKYPELKPDMNNAEWSIPGTDGVQILNGPGISSEQMGHDRGAVVLIIWIY